MLRTIIIFSILATNLFSAQSNHVSKKDKKAKSEIVKLLNKWSHDFNAKNVKAVCGLFATDLVASYPGTTDKNYEEMCRQLKASLATSDQTFHYDEPEIEQILIKGDLAVVRLIWTLRITSKNQSDSQVVKEKGLDVFRRQKDGSWQIAISYAYPESPNG